MAQIGSLFASLTLQSANFDSGIKRATRNTKKAEQDMGRSFGQMQKSGESTFKKLAAAAAGLGAAAGFGMIVSKIADVNTEYQKLQGMLFTATGSQQAAAKSMGELQKFAATTPFALNQVTDAFVKLKNLGLNPSMGAMKSYGNTASAMGKDIMQLIEAVADASTGEFERLKEFGIKSKQEGDKVSFTFQGVTTTVKKNAEDIQQYLLNIGNTTFAGAMDRQAETLGGALSNLGDTMDQLAVKFGEAGFSDGLEEAIRALNDSSGSVENFAQQLGYLTGQVLGTAVNAFTLIAQNIDTIATVAKVAATVIASRYAIALGTTAVAAARSFVVANTAAIAGMMAYTRVAPVMGSAAIAMSGFGAAAKGVLAIFGGPWGLAITAVVSGFLALQGEASATEAALNGVKAVTEDAANALKEAQDRSGDASTGVKGVGTEAATSETKVRSFAGAVGEAAQKLYDLAKARQVAAISDLEDRRRKASLQYSDLWKQSRAGLDARVEGDGSIGHALFSLDGWSADLTRLGRTLGVVDDPESELQEGMAQIKEDLANYDEAIARAHKNLEQFVPPQTNTNNGGGGGATTKPSGSKSKPEDPLKGAKDMVEQLSFQADQLQRTNEEQEVYNNLKQAGVTIESEYGKKIADQTRQNQATEAIRKNREALEQQKDAMEQATAEIGLNDRQLALLTLSREHDEQVTKGLADANDELYQAVVAATNAYYDKKEATDAQKEADEEAADKLARQIERNRREQRQLAEDIANIGIRAFDGLIKGTKSFGDAMKGVLTDIGDLMLEELIYKPLRELAKSALPQLLSSLLGNVGISIPGLGASATPAAVGKASGGEVKAGHEYWVGEHGPERFVAPANGRIIPHGASVGGGINIHVDARGSTNEAATKALVIEGIAQAMPQIKEASYGYTMQKAGRMRM